MARLSRFSEENAPAVKRDFGTKGKSIKLLHYTKLKDSKWQYCDEKDKDEIINLAWLIVACEGILQPLEVRKTDVDEYEILSGHKRRRAARYLVEEEGKKQYEFVPCIVLDISEVQAEFHVYASNGFHDKTDYEIMHELTHMKELLEKHPEEFPNLPAGRMVDKLASQMNMKKSTVGEYLQISKNLSEEGMKAFQTGELNKSAAVEISALSHQEQNRLLEEGVTKQKDIKGYKEEKLEREPIDVLPGQMKVVNTDMELEEEEKLEEEEPLAEAVVSPEVTLPETTPTINEPKPCNCPNCSIPTSIEKTFIFFNKTYCMGCLYDLLKDLEDTGVITIERSEADIKGNVIRS